MTVIEPPSNADFLTKALHIENEILNMTSHHDLDGIRSQWLIIEQQFQLALRGGRIPLLTENQVSCISKRIHLLLQNFSDVASTSLNLEPNYLEALGDLHLTRGSSIPSNSLSSKPFLRSLGHPKSSPTIPSRDPVSAYNPTPLPEFIEHAYKYFVANIHNPYPSREDKQAIVDISSNSRVTLTSVSNWFTNARRRCGWAEILKSRCKGNREEMINLAKRVFVKENSNRPVDAQIVAEFMEMKKNVETMYEKTRTSAWIGDLDQLISAISSEKHSEGKLKNRQAKNAIQAEALCKVDKTPRRIQQDKDSQNNLSRTASLSSLTSSDSTLEDDEFAVELNSVFDGRRKSSFEDRSLLHLRGSSPASSLSSFSFASEFSESRVPSLSWSDSGDEERPRKRPRSDADTPSPIPSELPFPLDDSLRFVPSSPANLIVPASRQKRSYDTSLDIDATPTAKRLRTDPTSLTAEPASDLMSSPISSTPSGYQRSSFSVVDFDSLLTLGNGEPHPVEITPPDTSVPLEVGVFDWSNPLGSFDFTGGLGLNVAEPAISSEHLLSDFSELFQMITSSDVPSEVAAIDSAATLSLDNTDVDAGIESPQSSSESSYAAEQSSPTHSMPDLQVDLSSFNLTSLWPQTPVSLPGAADVVGDHALDLISLLSNPISTRSLNGFPFDYSMQPPAQMPISHNSLETLRSIPQASTQDVAPLPGGVPLVPDSRKEDDRKESGLDLTGQDLAMVEKALRKEYKRRELEEKKAALERERARLEELERELEDD